MADPNRWSPADIDAMLLDLIDAYGLWDISITAIVVCFVALMIAFLTIGRKGHGNPKHEIVETEASTRDPVRQIVEARIIEGVEVSLLRCASLESELVGHKASADPSDSSEELELIENALRFIRWYRPFHEYHRTHRVENEQASQFVRHVSDCLSLDQGAFRELYKQLCNLTQAFSGRSFQQIVSALAMAALPAIRSRDVYFVGFLEVLYMSMAASRKFQKADEIGDRNLMLEELRRELHQAAERLRRVDADNSARRLVPAEFTLWLSDLSSLVGLVTEEARKATEGPAFEVTLPGGLAEITVESRYLRLNFVVEDGKRISGIQTISVIPRSQSSDLSYSGELLRKINFDKHVAEVAFTFDVYSFDNVDYDSTPKIVFDITYALFGVNALQSVQVTLPKLIPRPVFKNPFREGELGKGLPGTSKLFVGRHELLTDMASQLLETNAAFYWLHGLARTGKSSIMNQLSGNPHWLKERYTPIEIHAQASQGPWAFFLDIYHRVKQAIDAGGASSTAPDENFLRREVAPYWRPVVELLRLNETLLRRQKRRLLFLIDEVQDIAKTDTGKREAEKSAVWYQFPEFIKVLRDQYDEVTAVAVFGLWSLTDFDAINWHWTQQLGGRIEVRKVTNLIPPEADDLLLRQFTPYNVWLSESILSRIRKYTAAHPFLQMLMGYYLFERLTENGTLRVDREVSIRDVDVAAYRIPTDNLKFIWADPWIRDKPEVRLFLGALGQKSAEAGERNSDLTVMGSYSIDNLRDYLYEKFQIQFPHVDFQSVIGDLHAQQIIADVGKSDKRFELRYPLFASACARENLLGRFVHEWREKKLAQ